MKTSVKSILAATALAFSMPAAAARIDLHPQAFDCGGWSLDVQFMDVMGSPYLLAHGCGVRRTDAKAVVDIPEAGAWRVWTRARKWTDGAGAFLVKVNGAELPRKFGASQTEWAWEDGGEVELDRGRAEIALVDLDGFDGRCAGVVLARGEPAPAGPLSLGNREPDEVVEVDVAVVGGGMPGTCAAVAAARPYSALQNR